MIKLTENQKIAMAASVDVSPGRVSYGVILRSGSGQRRAALTLPGIRTLTANALVAEWRTLVVDSRVHTVQPASLEHVTSIKLNDKGLAMARELLLSQLRDLADGIRERNTT